MILVLDAIIKQIVTVRNDDEEDLDTIMKWDINSNKKQWTWYDNIVPTSDLKPSSIVVQEEVVEVEIIRKRYMYLVL